ncbi:MAG: hypothetical protein AAB923_02720 [Patescibacteria group bacterium]
MGEGEGNIVNLGNFRQARTDAADARIARTLTTYATLSKSGQPLWLTTTNDRGISDVHGRVVKVTPDGVVTVITSQGEQQVDLRIFPQAQFHAGSAVPKVKP